MRAIALLLFYLFNSNIAYSDAFSNDKFTLRAGFSFILTEVHTDKFINNQMDDGELDDETKTFGFGLVTSIGFRQGDWEFGFASDVLFGRIKDLTFISDHGSIRGDGDFRLVSLGPQIKYFIPYTLLNRANIYIGFGPAWSLQTFVFRDSLTTGYLSNKKRISFENYGGGLFIGLEEILPTKSQHPVFFEFGYSYMHSYRVSILDAENSANVVTLSQGDSNDFSAQYIIIRAGFTLF